MPYTVRRHSGCPKSKPYAVVKVDGGKRFGCHSSRASASRQIGAIEASEKRQKDMTKSEEVEITENIGYVTTANADDLVIENKKKSMHTGFPMPSAMSFDEYEAYDEAMEFLDESKELIVIFEHLARNIVEYAPQQEVGNKLSELASQFSTRVKKLFSGENSSSNDEDEGDMETESKDKEFSGMYVWKDQNGQYKWIARYSNNFRDRDYPPEIIAGESHKEFVKMVDEGLAELPDLQIWHEKGWTIGKADWVAYDEVDGVVFALAGGHFHPYAKAIAEKMAKIPVIGVSHGMPVPKLRRDPIDKSVIVRHVTTEISPLPPDVAANRIADFHIFSKEASSMTIPEQKRMRIAEDWNITPEELSQIEAANESDASKGLEEKIEHKEASQEVAEVEQDAAIEETTEEPSVETEIQDAETHEEPVSAPALDMEELGKAIGVLIKEAVAPMSEKIASLEARLQEITEEKTRVEPVEQDKSMTPTASMVSIARSVIGLPDTRVDGRTTLGKDKPKEQEAVDYQAPTIRRTIKSILAEHER